jgi:2-dehydropantoate 2-reductase
MLVDLEKGRAMEIDALLTAVQEMGRLVDVDSPHINAVLALIQQLGSTQGLYPTFPEEVLQAGDENIAVD